MNRRGELQIVLTVLISFFLHLVVGVASIVPSIGDMLGTAALTDDSVREAGMGRDITVNINEDDRQVVTPETLLSEKDSAAKGYITKKAGSRWLNNSLDFRALKGDRGQGKGGRAGASRSARERMLMSDDSEMQMSVERTVSIGGEAGNNGLFDEVQIPDKNDVTRENAIFYTSDGRFSFNTARFKDFKYFKNMKDKIASNWYPPLMANSLVQGYNPLSGDYAPGYTRIMAIPSQEVKIVFVLNKKGDIIHIQLLDSLGNKPLNASCYDAIRLSKSFGPVPKDQLTGEVLVIPFIFGYYVY
jgi:hypothetical protein